MRTSFIASMLLIVGFTGVGWSVDPPLGSATYSPSRERPFGWRGDGTGRFADANPPLVWSDTKNVRWSAVVGSGYSSPILTEKLIVVASEPNLLTAINRADGKALWKVQIKPADLADAKNQKAAAEYEPPKDGSGMMAATPLTDGKAIYMVLANGIVCAVDLEGKRKWTAYIDAEQNTGFGRSSSPLLAAGKLIVHMTNLYAFDPDTGKQLWANTEAASKYGTPALLKVGGDDLIVTPAGDAVRLADGKLVASDIGTATHTSTVAIDGSIYIGEAAISAVRLDSKFKATELWSTSISDEFFGSPLVHEGIWFNVSGKGELWAFDAKGKGEQRPLVEARQLFSKLDANAPIAYASVTLAGKHLFLNSNNGEIVVLEGTKTAKLVARNRLTTGSGASPIFSGKEMFLRDGGKLFCISH